MPAYHRSFVRVVEGGLVIRLGYRLLGSELSTLLDPDEKYA